VTALQVAGVARRSPRASAAPPRAGYGGPAASPVPWGPSDLIRLFVCNLIGAFGIVAAWLGASDTERFSTQFNFGSLGVLAFLVASFGNGSWLLTGRRAVGVRLAVLLDGDPRTRRDVRTDTLEDVDDHAPARSVAVRFTPGTLVTVPGTVRYHRDDCTLVRGKRLEQNDLGGHEAAGRRACELCLPARDLAPA
jgi:hypothetical protein